MRVFHARTSAAQGAAPESTGSEAGCSSPSCGSFARYDPGSCSWKTSQLSWLEGSETFSGSWPRAGTTRGGIAYRHPPSAPLTKGIASLLLPTPSATEAGSNQNGINGKGGANERPSAGTPTLYTMARRGVLPTPTARLGDARGLPSIRLATERLKTRSNLDDAVVVMVGRLPTPTANTSTYHNSHRTKIETLHGLAATGMLPTPRARDWKGDGKDCLPSALGVGGSLHPQFVEWMMGFPPGWTDLDGDDP